MADYAKALRKFLSEAGCTVVRQGKSDHEIWHSPISGVRFPVDSRIKSRHTANVSLKQVGLTKRF